MFHLCNSKGVLKIETQGGLLNCKLKLNLDLFSSIVFLINLLARYAQFDLFTN